MSMAFIALGISATATIYGTLQKKKAADAAAQVDQATANYNAKYDEALAKQLDLDTIQNIRTERANAAVYLSRQEAGYAGAGVLATSGSPLHAMITNAGRFEQRIQQDWVNSQQKQQQYYAAAKVGRLEGEAKASADRMQGTIALINGAAQLGGTLASAYGQGMFNQKPASDQISNLDLF